MSGRHLGTLLRFIRFVGIAVLAALATSRSPAIAATPAAADALWSPGVRDDQAGLPGRWERELARRENLLRRHRGREPAAILALLGLFGELGGEIDVSRLKAFLDRVRGDRRRDARVRAYADYLRAKLLERQGRIDEARDLYERTGWLLSWQLIGPFDNAEGRGHTTAYEPEKQPFSPDQRMVGKLPGEDLQWRVYDYASMPRGGYISFYDVLRPTEQVTAYATTWVKAPRSAPAVLVLGTGGPYRAWVGGVLVAEGDAYRTPHPLQDAHAIELRAGWNRILLKVSALEGVWGFHARISAASGAPISGLEHRADPPEQAPMPVDRGTAGTPRPGDSLRRALEEAHARPRAQTSDGLALVEFYRWVHPFDHADRTAADLAAEVDRRGATARSAWLRALLDPDQNTSREALIEGIARARAEGQSSRHILGRLLLELAWRYGSLGLEREASNLITQARAASPDDAVIELADVDRLAGEGFPLLAFRWVEDLLRRYPKSAVVRQEHVARLLELGRTDEALVALEQIASEGGIERVLTPQRIDALLRVGRADAAADLARESSERLPGFASEHARLARLEEARGSIDGARAALARAIALVPQDADLHARMGRLLARTGDHAGAVASLRRSLALMPQQPEVRDLLGTLERSERDDLFATYAVDFDEVAGRSTPRAWRGKPAGILHNLVAVRVLPNGLSERLEQRIIRILDDRGIRDQFAQGMAYDPAESMVEVRRARVRRKDGSVEELGETHVYSLAQAGFRMYYDQQEKQVRFAGLRVGDTVEVAFVRRDLAARNKFHEYFGDLVALQGVEPRLHTEYILEAPADKPLHFNLEVERKKSKRGDRAVHRLVRRNVPGIKPEAKMPGWTEVAKYLHVSTYATWDDVGRWYWNLVRDQLVVDAKIREGVRQALTGLPPDANETEKIRAIYEHVVRNTRYVGLEFGIHGYKPYRTTDVYERRFGDCKDKASLLKVMLGELGIDAHLVLVRTRDRGTIASKPASLAAFNHAIIYVPGHDLYLDGTAEWSGPGELPANDQGATALIVEDGRATRLVTIPFGRAGVNLRSIAQTARIQRDGSARIEHDTTVTGVDAAALRYGFQSEEHRVERLAKIWGRTFPGTVVEEVRAPGIDDILMPARLGARLRVPGWARVESGRLRFRVLGRRSILVQNLAPQGKREHDLVLETPTVEQQELRYVLPRGMRFSQLPSSREIETDVGYFVLDVRARGDEAEVRTRLELRRHRITTAEYGAFREFLRQVDASLEQTFEVERAR
jgi:tetratricopeptide (TPR) repeat protein